MDRSLETPEKIRNLPKKLYRKRPLAACDSLREEAGRRAGCGKSARPVR